MTTSTFAPPDIAPPSKLLLMLEGRAVGEYAALLLSWPFLRLPRGDGHAVLVVPGFGASDASTLTMRRILRGLGYDVHGWGLGRNLGARGVRNTLGARLDQLHAGTGRKVSLIGWSLGGVYVREIARAAPQHVRRVITLGSPINGHPHANNADALYRRVNGLPPSAVDWESFNRRRVAPPVPCTAIYSRSDGIVAWQCSREDAAPNTENVEVFGSHFGLGVNPQVLRAIAARLALPEK